MDMLAPIHQSGIAGTAVSYPWNMEVSRAIRHPIPGEHERLANAWGLVDLRACFAAALATAEWVAWRFAGIVDVQDTLHRIEAGYAAEVDVRFGIVPQPTEPFPSKLREVHGPLMLCRMLIADSYELYVQSDTVVAAVGVSLSLLARHVCLPEAPFEAWLESSMRALHRSHPSGVDAAGRPPVPRELFAAPEDWDPARTQDALQSFLAGLDPARNPYLKAGIPFQLD